MILLKIAFQLTIDFICGGGVAKLSQAHFFAFLLGLARGGTLAHNQGETNCGGFVL